MKKTFLLLIILMAVYFFEENITFFNHSIVSQSNFASEVPLQKKATASLFQWVQQPLKIETPSDALAAGERFIKGNESLFPIRSYHQLKGRVIENPMGMRVKYEVSQNEIPVVGMEIELQINSLGKVAVLSNSYHPIEKVELNRDSWLSLAEVIEGQEQTYKFSGTEGSSGADSIVIYVEPGKFRGEIGYNVSVLDANKKNSVMAHAVFSVMSGQVLARHIARSEF